MRHGDVSLCESKAIATYLDKVFDGPRVIPEDASGAAAVEQWVSLVNTAVDPCMVRSYLFQYIFPKGADGKPDRAAIEQVLPAMQKQFDILDGAVTKSGHLAGNGYSSPTST
jgi:glutathione S-transferase